MVLQTIYWLPLRKSILNNCITYTIVLANKIKTVFYIFIKLSTSLSERFVWSHSIQTQKNSATLNNKYFHYMLYYEILFLKKNSNKSHTILIPKSIVLLRQVNELLTNFWHSHVLYIPDYLLFLFILMCIGIVSTRLWIILTEISERNRWFGRPEYKQHCNTKFEAIKKSVKFLARLVWLKISSSLKFLSAS